MKMKCSTRKLNQSFAHQVFGRSFVEKIGDATAEPV